MGPLMSVNVTVDQITQGYRLLRRFNQNTDKLIEITVIGNLKDIPESTSMVRYEALALDQFIGEKAAEWDGHSPITLYFNDEGVLDHWEKTSAATAGATAA